ncbi:MAG: zinc-binding dehydrogenase [Candidatus Obscuribacterales bacterium]|nr:zinc-binding dehydrogenase [Candidatus Obscuribacterales bacterium]
MKALVATKFGDTDVLKLEEVEKPQLGADDLLIEVHATAMNPVDTKARKHGLGGLRVPPFVLGFDVSGVVRESGSNAAAHFKVGDEVFGLVSLFRNGANAEFVAADYRTMAKKPASVSHIQAAALPIALLTAWDGIYDRLQVKSGETVLIHAGGGGVGHIAIQLAKLKGAKVITTASSNASIELVKSLGADIVINHKQEDFAKKVLELTNNNGVEAIFDCVGGPVFAKSLDCIAPGGRIATIVEGSDANPSEKLFFKNASLHYVFIGAPLMYNLHPELQGKVLSEAAKLAEQGKLKAHVSQVLTLEQLAEAHKLQESGTVTGKIGIKVLNN